MSFLLPVHVAERTIRFSCRVTTYFLAFRQTSTRVYQTRPITPVVYCRLPRGTFRIHSFRLSVHGRDHEKYMDYHNYNDNSSYNKIWLILLIIIIIMIIVVTIKYCQKNWWRTKRLERIPLSSCRSAKKINRISRSKILEIYWKSYKIKIRNSVARCEFKLCHWAQRRF